LIGDKIVVATVSKINGQTVVFQFTEPSGNGAKFTPAGTLLVKEQYIGFKGINDIFVCGDLKTIHCSECNRLHTNCTEGAENKGQK
jgi:hypothetical protein